MYGLSLDLILVGWSIYVVLCFVKGNRVFHVVMKNQLKSRGCYKKVTGTCEKNWIYKIFIMCVKFIDSIFKILFPNWIISDYFKCRIKKSLTEVDSQIKKDKLKEFIETMNSLNFLISVICLLIISFLASINVGEGECFFKLFIFILCLRAFSRSYEIIKAFLEDVLDKKSNKSSSLKYYDRLRLALISLFEVVINYSFVYYFCTENLVGALRESIGNSLLVSVNEINFVTIFQVLTSMTLIYLALADYIGSKGEKEENRMKKTIVRRRDGKVIEEEEIVETEEVQDNKDVIKEVECCDMVILLGLIVMGFLILACSFGIYLHSDNPICITCPVEETSRAETHEEINIDINMTVNEDYMTQTEVKDWLELGE